MEKNIADKMKKLKNEIYEKKENIRDIQTLVNKEIDKEWNADVTDFSERELESRMDENISFLSDHANPIPEITSWKSHRKIIGKPIIWGKRIIFRFASAYFTHILEKQKTFNQKCLESFQILKLHQKKRQQKISGIEERIGECDMQLKALTKKLEELEAMLDQAEDPLPNRKPDPDETP